MKAGNAPSDQAEYEQRRWKIFLLLGISLLAGGGIALLVPNFSTYASSVVMGIVLMGIGIFKIIQSLAIKNWAGFIWQELTGVLELIGGIMVYFNPLKGALAVTFLIAVIILAIIGLTYHGRNDK